MFGVQLSPSRVSAPKTGARTASTTMIASMTNMGLSFGEGRAAVVPPGGTTLSHL
ncbi:hypothetical protein ACTIVE_6778 [Actinomadura verrucosospora]|uniref:Uncharacterized protein n=1 Tax=Actinomadura verrucosospora TaxID=46165 RepID=A0A7D4AA24_ACTVE|nr:hypothetical protein ACTIVE_6778 [Actinomadura verrucosospora]